MPARIRILVLLLCCLSAAGCGKDPSTELKVSIPTSITVSSAAFPEGGAIPVRFTCDGEATSPPLRWRSQSTAPRAWALVVDDPDAASGTYVHWVVLDIPPGTHSLAAGSVPEGAVQADNSAGRTAYAAPCPPSGTHRYRFTAYALSAPTGLSEGASLASALAAIGDGAVDRGTLLGTYHRGG